MVSEGSTFMSLIKVKKSLNRVLSCIKPTVKHNPLTFIKPAPAGIFYRSLSAGQNTGHRVKDKCSS